MKPGGRPKNITTGLNSPGQWKAQPISKHKKSAGKTLGCLAMAGGGLGFLIILGFAALFLIQNPDFLKINSLGSAADVSVPVVGLTSIATAGQTPITGEMPPTWTPDAKQPLIQTPTVPTQAFLRAATQTPIPSAVSFSRAETESTAVIEINTSEYESVSLELLLDYPAVYTDKKVMIEGQIISFGEVVTPSGVQFGVEVIPFDRHDDDEAAFWTPVLVLNLPPDPLFELDQPLKIYAEIIENTGEYQVQELYWNAPILIAASYKVLE